MNPVEYRVVFDPLAEIEALDAAAYIARDSPRNAVRWYEGLRKAIKSLSMFPHRCAIAPEAQYLSRDLRHYIYKSHRVIFEVIEDERLVRVLHIRHSARRAMGEPDPDQ